MRLHSVALLAMWVAACGGDTPAAPPTPIGDFQIEATGAQLIVRSAVNPARTLLESAPPVEAPYVPAAVRAGKATWESLYGAFKIVDDSGPWRYAVRLVMEKRTADEVVATWRDAAGPLMRLTATAPAAGTLRIAVQVVPQGINRLSLAFVCGAGEHFLGFGAQADGIDHRGHKIPIWTSEPGIGKSESDDPGTFWFVEGPRHASSLGLASWLSSRGYLGAVETDHRSIFEMCSERENAWRVEVWAPELVLWIYDGPTPKEALTRATAGVLGRPPRPHPVAFAPWNDAIFGDAEVRRIAKLIRDNKIASSVLWTEDFRGGEEWDQGYRLIEEWDTDTTLYPNPSDLAAHLTGLGIAWHAYFNTFLVQGTRIFTEAEQGGHLVRNAEGTPYLFQGATFQPTGLADLSRAETRAWIKGYMRRALDIGFTGWMADFGEWLPHDAVLASGEDPLAAHNRYPHEWVKLNTEVMAERAGQGKPLTFFARSGWLGSTRATPVLWAGDQRTSFKRDDGLYTVIPMGLNLGLAGFSTYAHDIAGYQSSTNPVATKELFFRWSTAGALAPVMRTHHGTKPRENWWFGKDAETLAHYKRWAGFHMRMFPYLDGGSAVAEATGIPLMRALPLEFPEDEAGWSLSDQYLLGPALLVAPVVDEGKTSRQVHFPPGRWLPLDEGLPIDGPTDQEVAAPLTEIPLYARAGSVVPLLPAGVETALPADPPTVTLASVENQRVLLVFLGGDGGFTERDGTTYTLSGMTTGAPASFVEGSTTLSACASAEARGCVGERDDSRRRATLRLSGTGPLAMGEATLSVSGGAARTLDVVVRW